MEWGRGRGTEQGHEGRQGAAGVDPSAVARGTSKRQAALMLWRLADGKGKGRRAREMPVRSGATSHAVLSAWSGRGLRWALRGSRCVGCGW